MAKYRRRRRRSDHNIDDWLMTYADMITLLLCFFAIFLSISVPKADQMKKAQKQVMEQFAAPNALAGKTIQFDDGVGAVSESSYDRLPSIVGTFNEGEGEDAPGTETSSAETIDLNKKPPPKKETRKKLKDGDRIVTMEMPSAAFFASGSADLSEDGKKLLQGVVDQKLKADNFQDYIITVEGHTDDAPIKTYQFPSNWELSTARAAAVVRYFIERGISPQRLRAAGYADSFPKVPNRDGVGKPIPDNQAQNRRVVIKLEKIEKAD